MRHHGRIAVTAPQDDALKRQATRWAAEQTATPHCRWCGRPHGDPQCRCERLRPAEPDEDVRLAEPTTEEGGT